MALEAGQELRQFPAYASGSFFHHNRMRWESVIGRHFIQILSRVVVTLNYACAPAQLLKALSARIIYAAQ